jgi:hypothetical protein
MPLLDDWDAILGFMNAWTEADAGEKMKLLMSQHNEHRLLSSRLIYVLYYKINNGIDFKSLAFISNLQLLVIFGILVHFSAKLIKQTWPIISFFIALCIFDPSNFENSTMAMAGMANYGVIMLFVICLYLYSLKSKHALLLAVIIQVLCTFSNGNGIIAGAALVFYAIGSREKTKIMASLLSFITSGILYYQNYSKGGENLTGKNITSIIEFFLNLLGGHFDRDYRVITAICLLIITLGVFYFSYKRIISGNKELLPFLSIIIFILLTTASISVFRSGQENMIKTYSYLSRYLIYPHLYAGITMILIVYYLEKTKFQWIGIAIIGFLFIKAYSMNYKYGEQGFGIFRGNVTRKKHYYPREKEAERISKESCDKRIYCLEENREYE